MKEHVTATDLDFDAGGVGKSKEAGLFHTGSIHRGVGRATDGSIRRTTGGGGGGGGDAHRNQLFDLEAKIEADIERLFCFSTHAMIPFSQQTLARVAALGGELDEEDS